MCGILAAFGDVYKISDTEFEGLLNKLEHRGPDETGMLHGENYFLGHKRLSIIDIATGRQPLESINSTYKLICNGEIYNYKELKKKSNNYKFSTKSDSEVIIPLYQKSGADLVNQLQGMFSFVLSGPRKRIFTARDPIGIKPLYYGIKGKRIYFSSEIKSIINCVDKIYEFPKGTYFDSKEGFKPYYKLPKITNFISNLDVAIEKIRKTLKESVKKRLVSDVPIGVFLSGGLDSSIIAKLMKEELNELHSFSVGFEGSPDIEAARKVAKHIGTIHHEHIYSKEDVLEILPEVIYYLESYDAALVRSAIPCFLVSKLASKYVKVVLSGEGADELFAGYSYFSKYDDPEALYKETVRILDGLHNLNLQRVDRMTMAHALEARVPFLDINFIETVLSIDPRLKLHSEHDVEKWLLRKAFEENLPREIIWRDKMEFAQGCSSSTCLLEHANKVITDAEFESAKNSGEPVLSKEEMLYYNYFLRDYNHPEVFNLIGKWRGKLH